MSSLIKTSGAGTIEERLARLEKSVNFSPVVIPLCTQGPWIVVPWGIGASWMATVTVDFAWFRERYPSRKMMIRMDGFMAPTAATAVTLSIQCPFGGGVIATYGPVIPPVGPWTPFTVGPADMAAVAGTLSLMQVGGLITNAAQPVHTWGTSLWLEMLPDTAF